MSKAATPPVARGIAALVSLQATGPLACGETPSCATPTSTAESRPSANTPRPAPARHPSPSIDLFTSSRPASQAAAPALPGIAAPKALGVAAGSAASTGLRSAVPATSADATADSRGAKMPFVTYEAERPQNGMAGELVEMVGVPDSRSPTPAMEASGRAFVALTETGHRLDISSKAEASHMWVRFAMPDAQRGGGLQRTLSVYVNGEKRDRITLSSKHAWLYNELDAEGRLKDNGQSNDPTLGGAHQFWSEMRFEIPGGVKPGDIVTLQKDSNDTAAYYNIDLVELEQASEPNVPPVPHLSVVDFGADPTGTTDSAEAIQRCMDEAKKQGVPVWLPPGTYLQSTQLIVDGITVHGAGKHHTKLVGFEVATNFAGTMGFRLRGDGAVVSDLHMESTADTRRTNSNKGFVSSVERGQATNFLIENISMSNVGVGAWLSGVQGGLIRNVELRGTYADGLNINRGSANVTLDNVFVRGTGDDSLALLSETDRGDPASRNNRIINATATAPWWGGALSVSGGDNHRAENAYVADAGDHEAVRFNLTRHYPGHPVQDAQMENVTVVRGGGNFKSQGRAAVFVLPGSNPVDASLRNIDVIDPYYSAIDIRGPEEVHMLVDNATVVGAGRAPVSITANASGSLDLHDVHVAGANPNASLVDNNAGDAFQVTVLDSEGTATGGNKDPEGDKD